MRYSVIRYLITKHWPDAASKLHVHGPSRHWLAFSLRSKNICEVFGFVIDAPRFVWQIVILGR